MNNNDPIERIFRARFKNEESPVSERVWDSIKSTLLPEKQERPFTGKFITSISVVMTAICLGVLGYRNTTSGSLSLEDKMMIKSNENAGKMANEGIPMKEAANEKKILASRKEFSEAITYHLSDNKKSPVFKGEKLFAVSDNGIEISRDNSGVDKEAMKLKDKVMTANRMDFKKAASPGHVKQSLKLSGPVTGNSTSLDRIIPDEKRTIEVSLADKESSKVLQTHTGGFFSTSEKIFHTEYFNKEDQWFETGNEKDEPVLSAAAADTSVSRFSDKQLAGDKNNLVSEEEEGVEKTDSVQKDKKEALLKKGSHSAAKQKKEKLIGPVPISLDIFALPSLSYRTMSEDSKENINSHENMKLNIGGGIRANMEINEKIRIGLGLQYLSYGERYKVDNNVYQQRVQYKGYWTRDSLGAFDYIVTDTIHFQTQRPPEKRNNYYRYIGIPLSVTYMFNSGKLSVGLSGGASLNILLKAYTSRISTINDTSSYIIEESSLDKESPFRPIAFSVFVNPCLTYDINDKWKLLIEPGFSYFISSVYKSDYPLVKRPYAIELKAGLRFKF